MSQPALKLPEEPEETGADELYNLESVGGLKMMSPRPARKHTRSATRMTMLLSRYDLVIGPLIGGPGGWLILAEPELRLEVRDKAGVAPDLAGWRQERAPEDTDEAAYYTPPDWVCEVQSPSTKTWDRESKMPFYAFHRVGHLWMVEPMERRIEVYALGRRGWELLQTVSGNKVVALEPFEQVGMDLSIIWQQYPVR